MSLPPVIRIFFAVEVPASVKEQLGSYMGVLKKATKSHAIRWTRPENLHITLQFLAEIQSEQVPRLVDSVKQALAQKHFSPHLTLGSLQLFPNPYRPRVIVLKVTPQEALQPLAEIIGQCMIESDYPVDERPFRAHLTLGRIKQPHGMNFEFLSKHELAEKIQISVQDIVLFRSEPQPEGSVYTEIERILLP